MSSRHQIHRLSFRQGFKPAAGNGSVVDENIFAVFLGNESKALDSLNHLTVPFITRNTSFRSVERLRKRNKKSHKAYRSLRLSVRQKRKLLKMDITIDLY